MKTFKQTSTIFPVGVELTTRALEESGRIGRTETQKYDTWFGTRTNPTLSSLVSIQLSDTRYMVKLDRGADYPNTKMPNIQIEDICAITVANYDTASGAYAYTKYTKDKFIISEGDNDNTILSVPDMGDLMWYVHTGESGYYALYDKGTDAKTWVSTIEYETITPIDPKYLPSGGGGGLPVVTLSTVVPVNAEDAILSAEESAAFALAAEKQTPVCCIFTTVINGISLISSAVLNVFSDNGSTIFCGEINPVFFGFASLFVGVIPSDNGYSIGILDVSELSTK